MLLYVLALSDFINFALKRDSPRATSPRPEWTINCSLPTQINIDPQKKHPDDSRRRGVLVCDTKNLVIALPL